MGMNEEIGKKKRIGMKWRGKVNREIGFLFGEKRG